MQHPTQPPTLGRDVRDADPTTYLPTMIDKNVLKSPKFWLTLLLTNVAIAVNSGLVLDGSTAAQAVAWLLLVGGVLGFRPWVPPTDETPKES